MGDGGRLLQVYTGSLYAKTSATIEAFMGVLVNTLTFFQCRLSNIFRTVRLSVTLVICDHIGWKSWKLIAHTSQKAIHLLQREHGEILGRLEVGREKWRSGEQKRQYL